MPRKGESIFKRNDGRWEGRWIKARTAGGKALYGYVYGKNYAEVKQKLSDAKLHAADREEEEPALREISFAELTEDWLRERSERVKISTFEKYRNLANSYLLPQLGDIRVAEMTEEGLKEFYGWLLNQAGMKGEGLSLKTIGDAFALLRSILNGARKRKIPLRCTGKEIVLKSKREPLSILTLSEQQRLTDCLMKNPTGLNLGILISLNMGLRIGEVCALKWEDVSQYDRCLHVSHTLQRIQCSEDERKTKIVILPPKSLSSDRILPVPTVLQGLLDSPGEGYLLTGNEKFVEPRSMENHFKRVLKQADIRNVNFHCLRHTFATRCVEAGFDVKTLSIILGHANVNTTLNLYVHPTMDMKRENMERLNNLFPPK